MAAEEPAEETGLEVALQEGEAVADDGATWTSGVGEWDGQTYSMKYFPCMPENVEEGDLVWSQTMGKVYISYMLSDDQANLTVDDVKLEVSRSAIRTKFGGKKGKDLEPLSGNFYSFVRAGTTWWSIIDVEDGRKLYIVLQKFDHMSWRSLFRDHDTFNRQSFAWNKEMEGKFFVKEDLKMRQIMSDSPIDSLEVPEDISWQAMCIGLDDFQDSEEFVVVTLRFDPKELEAINRNVPNEELFGADITEKEVAVFFRVYEYGQPIVAFRGVLEGTCVPQLTTWEFLPNVESRHPLISGYTPAVQLVLTKQADSQGTWSRVFTEAKHASELHAPQAGTAVEKAASLNNAGKAEIRSLEVPKSKSKGPPVSRPAVVAKFKELMKEGLSSREATTQAITFVREKASAGEPWALEGFEGALGSQGADGQE